MDTYTEVIHCMWYYLHDIWGSCSSDYYRKRKAEVLEAAREMLDAVSYKALLRAVEEMEEDRNA